MRRWDAISQALDRKITGLDDVRAYQPEALDARAAAVSGPLQTAVVDCHLPAFGELWDLGPGLYGCRQRLARRVDRPAQHWRSISLDLLQALTLDDTDPATLSAFEDAEGPPPPSVCAA